MNVKTDSSSVPLYNPSSVSIMAKYNEPIKDPFKGAATEEQAYNELKTNNWLHSSLVNNNFSSARLQEAGYIRNKFAKEEYEVRRLAYEYYTYVAQLRSTTSIATYLKRDLNNKREGPFNKTQTYTYLQ